MSGNPFNFINPNTNPFLSDRRDKDPFFTNRIPFEFINNNQFVHNPINPINHPNNLVNNFNPRIPPLEFPKHKNNFLLKSDVKGCCHIYMRDHILKRAVKLCNKVYFMDLKTELNYVEINDEIHTNLSQYNNCPDCYNQYKSLYNTNDVNNMINPNNPNNPNYRNISDIWNNYYGLSNVGYCYSCNNKIIFDPLLYPNADNMEHTKIPFYDINQSINQSINNGFTKQNNPNIPFKITNDNKIVCSRCYNGQPQNKKIFYTPRHFNQMDIDPS